MKKILLLVSIGVFISVASNAQTTPPKVKVETANTEVKAKPTSTIPQKINNVIRPKHKKYSGYKVKRKVSHK